MVVNVFGTAGVRQSWRHRFLLLLRRNAYGIIGPDEAVVSRELPGLKVSVKEGRKGGICRRNDKSRVGRQPGCPVGPRSSKVKSYYPMNRVREEDGQPNDLSSRHHDKPSSWSKQFPPVPGISSGAT